MTNCVMKYNKNNTFSGINIYNKLDKDIQEIIDNYLIQMRKEEEQDEQGLIDDLKYDENFQYRRFMTEFNLHYKFNNSIMKNIATENVGCTSLNFIMLEYLIAGYYYRGYDNMLETVIDTLFSSVDNVIDTMFKNGNGNEELFKKVCKIINENPFKVICEGTNFMITDYGITDYYINSTTFDYAKILTYYLIEKIRDYMSI